MPPTRCQACIPVLVTSGFGLMPMHAAAGQKEGCHVFQASKQSVKFYCPIPWLPIGIFCEERAKSGPGTHFPSASWQHVWMQGRLSSAGSSFSGDVAGFSGASSPLGSYPSTPLKTPPRPAVRSGLSRNSLSRTPSQVLQHHKAVGQVDISGRSTLASLHEWQSGLHLHPWISDQIRLENHIVRRCLDHGDSFDDPAPRSAICKSLVRSCLGF